MGLKSKNNDFWTRLQKKSAEDIYAEVKKRYADNPAGVVDLLASELYGDINTVDSNKKVYDIALAAFIVMAMSPASQIINNELQMESVNAIVDFIAGNNITISRSGSAITISSNPNIEISEHELEASDFTDGTAQISHNLDSDYLSVTSWVWNTSTKTEKTVGLRLETINSNELSVTTDYVLDADERYRIIIARKL